MQNTREFLTSNKIIFPILVIVIPLVVLLFIQLDYFGFKTYAFLIGFGFPAFALSIIVTKHKRLFPYALISFMFLENIVIDLNNFVTISKLGIGLLFLSFIINNKIHFRLLVKRTQIPLICWFLYSFISVIWSVAPSITLSRSVSLLLLFGFTWMLIEFVTSHEDFIRFLKAIILFGLLNSLITIGQSLNLINFHIRGDDRAVGLIFDPNLNSFQIGVAIILVVIFWLTHEYNNGWLKSGKTLILILMFLFIGLFFTQSRGGILSLIFTLFIIFLVSIRRKAYRQRTFSIILLISTIIAGMIIIIPDTTILILSRFSGIQDDNFGYRLPIFKLAVDLFLKRPLFGYGLASFPVLNYQATGRALVTHNIFLNLLISGGIIGFGVFMLMIKRIFTSIIKKIHGSEPKLFIRKLALLGMVIYSLTMGLTLELTFSKTIWLTISLAIISEKLILNSSSRIRALKNSITLCNASSPFN